MSNPITNLFARKLDVQFYGPNRIVKMTEAELQELRDIMKDNPYVQEYVYDREAQSQDRTKPTLDLNQMRQKLELRKEWWSANSEGVKVKKESIINLLVENGMDKDKAEAIAKTYDKKREKLIPANVKDKYAEIMKDAPKDIFTLKEYQSWAKAKNVKVSEKVDVIDALNKGIDNTFLKLWEVEKTMRMAAERRKQLIEAHNAEIGKVAKQPKVKVENTIVNL
jgi:hypothetical protein